MAAIVTDQFRVQNASSFIDSLSNNSYYVFLGLSNPGTNSASIGFGRSTTWDATPSLPPNPVDNLNYLSHYRDTILFGKKIEKSSVRRVVPKVEWTANTKYDMYRHDYDVYNPTPNSGSSNLYKSNFYVVNRDYRVYICLYNGSSGSNVTGQPSQDEPLFTDLEPSTAGSSNDGYIWKYLFTIAPSDIVKFDSTEFIVLPNDWDTTTDFEIKSVRDSGNSSINNNQIKIVYIENSGSAFYESGTYPILGDGTGAEVQIETNTQGEIVKTRVVSGGSGYTFGIVDLKSPASIPNDQKAKLIPIIPPSKGHGYDVYTELGADRVLIYNRFDTSTKEFVSDTSFAQVGILKNPESYSSTNIFSDTSFSGLFSVKLTANPSTFPLIGEKISQQRSDGGNAVGYVASYDTETKVLKYYQDRSLYFQGDLNVDQIDDSNITLGGQVLAFESSAQAISAPSGFQGSVDTGFSGSVVTIDNKTIGLGVTFSDGLSQPEINKRTGDIIYIDNRSIVTRSIRQKEDVKIILEF